MKMANIAWLRIIFIVSCIVASCAIFLLSDDQLKKMDIFGDLLSVISIFAGVLLAVLGVFANASNDSNFKAAVLLKDAIEGKVERLILLLRVYFIAIIFIIVAKGLQSTEVFSEQHFLYLKAVSLSLGLFSVLISLGLTSSIASAFAQEK